MTWDPYGMPNAPSGQPDDDRNRRTLEPQPVRVRTILAILGAMVLLALVFSLAAEAQEATDGEQDSEAVVQQQEQQEEQPAAVSTTEATEGEAQDAESAQAAPTPLDGQIVEQPEGTYAASDLIGQSVMSAEGEAMGKISDLLIAEDSGVVGAVVGIGGFLGIGQKPIAIEIDRITRTTTQDGVEQLALDYTRSELENAPAFITLAERKRRQEAEQARQEQEQLQQEQLQQQGTGQSGEALTQ